MADTTYAEITTPKDEPTVFGLLVGKLAAAATSLGVDIPATYWQGGDPIPSILRHGLTPMLAQMYSYARDIARGGTLRGAQALAEAQIALWEADPLNTFLGWLAQEIFDLTPAPPVFAQGWLRVTNAGGPTTLPATFSVRDPSTGLQFTLVGGAQTVPRGDSYVQIRANAAGPDYNLAAGTITRLVSSLAGITVTNQPQPPAGSWLITYGARRESPARTVERCRGRWALQPPLQTAPADAYRALALNPDVTGTSAPKKVAVWGHYRDGVGHAPNYVTLYLAGDAAPVDNATADQVRDALRPFLGVHDLLVVKPSGSVTYPPVLATYVAAAADIPVVLAALEQQRRLLQARLDIGQPVYASDIRRCVLSIPQVKVQRDTLTDFVPAKNALIALDFSEINALIEVGP